MSAEERAEWIVDAVKGIYESAAKKLQWKSDLKIAYVIWLFTGVIGGHNIYLRRPLHFVCYVATLLASLLLYNLLLIWYTFLLIPLWWFGDAIRLKWLVEDTRKDVKPIRILDAYQLWFSPVGVFGFHQWYLGNTWRAAGSLFTASQFLVGWFFDGFAMVCLVQDRAEGMRHEMSDSVVERETLTAYMLWLPLSGLFGLHHFYLRRYFFGFLYMFTFGLCGVGWVVDLFRMYWMTQAANEHHPMPLTQARSQRLLDCYQLLLPLGFFGLHRFYLGNIKMGLVYLFTLGGCGVLVIFDMCRMLWLVNESILEEYKDVGGAPVLQEHHSQEQQHDIDEEEGNDIHGNHQSPSEVTVFVAETASPAVIPTSNPTSDTATGEAASTSIDRIEKALTPRERPLSTASSKQVEFEIPAQSLEPLGDDAEETVWESNEQSELPSSNAEGFM